MIVLLIKMSLKNRTQRFILKRMNNKIIKNIDKILNQIFCYYVMLVRLLLHNFFTRWLEFIFYNVEESRCFNISLKDMTKIKKNK